MKRRGFLLASFSSWLVALFGLNTAAEAQSTSDKLVTLDDPRYEAYANARRQYWEQFGQVDSDVIGYLISPEFQGVPPWPTTRQAFLIVRTENSLILASDGMTDLFVDTNIDEAGYGQEVYIEIVGMQLATFEEIKASWAFSLIENFARNVADRGGITKIIDEYGVLSMALPAPEGMPSNWVWETESVGILIGLSSETRPAKLRLDAQNEIQMTPISLITPIELDYVVEGGENARAKLAALYEQSGLGVATDVNRKSLI